MLSKAVGLLSALIDPSDTRIRQLPDFILVFGGPLGDPRGSARQIFLNWIDLNRSDLSQWIRKPEDYQDWNDLDGYANLIDFERDALCLTRAVVLFSESPGSHAELGAFCMDPILSERLFVVISEKHYNAGSFISKGPVKKIEDISEDSICTVKSIAPLEMQSEIQAIVESLDGKLKTLPKSMIFDSSRSRDQFLLVADLIELFGALTVSEIVELCEFMNFKTTAPHVKYLFNQLQRFGMVTSIKKNTYKYYIPTDYRFSFLDYKSKIHSSAFDRLRFKTKTSFSWLMNDKKRYEAYCDVHGVTS